MPVLRGELQTCRETTNVCRRILIQGQGPLGETRYDMRGNSPALRLSACCVVRGLDIDMTGFREALKIEGPHTARPLVLNCIIRCIWLPSSVLSPFSIAEPTLPYVQAYCMCSPVPLFA